MAAAHGYDFKLLKGVLEINAEQRRIIIERLESMLGGERGRVAVLGLAFKNNTDDLRESPALDIVKKLLKSGHRISVYDPVAAAKARDVLSGVEFAADAYEAAAESDLLLLATEWEEFKWLDWRRVRELMKQPLIFDARNCLDPKSLRSLGFTYQGIGR